MFEASVNLALHQLASPLSKASSVLSINVVTCRRMQFQSQPLLPPQFSTFIDLTGQFLQEELISHSCSKIHCRKITGISKGTSSLLISKPEWAMDKIWTWNKNLDLLSYLSSLIKHKTQRVYTQTYHCNLGCSPLPTVATSSLSFLVDPCKPRLPTVPGRGSIA